MVKLGSVISWLLIGYGAYTAAAGTIILGYFRHYGYDYDLKSATERYLWTDDVLGARDQGLLVLLAGVVLGLLVMIAKKRGR